MVDKEKGEKVFYVEIYGACTLSEFRVDYAEKYDSKLGFTRLPGPNGLVHMPNGRSRDDVSE